MSLPSTAITVVHRSDSSGTTDGFTKFLAAVSPTWKSQVGARQGRQVADRHGRREELRRRRRGQADHGRGRLRRAGVRARERVHVRGDQELVRAATSCRRISNTSAAANGITVPADLGISTINSPNAQARTRSSRRRSSTSTRIRARAAAPARRRRSGLKQFLTYAFGAGQKTLGSGSSQLPYAPLPSSLVAKDNAQLATMVCNGSPIS